MATLKLRANGPVKKHRSRASDCRAFTLEGMLVTARILEAIFGALRAARSSRTIHLSTHKPRGYNLPVGAPVRSYSDEPNWAPAAVKSQSDPGATSDALRRTLPLHGIPITVETARGWHYSAEYIKGRIHGLKAVLEEVKDE